jgi:hypothetical protein
MTSFIAADIIKRRKKIEETKHKDVLLQLSDFINRHSSLNGNPKEQILNIIDIYDIVNQQFEILFVKKDNPPYSTLKMFYNKGIQFKELCVDLIENKKIKIKQLYHKLNSGLKKFQQKCRKYFPNDNFITETSCCSICLENIDFKDEHITICKHSFHAACISHHISYQNNCPMCRTSFSLCETI